MDKFQKYLPQDTLEAVRLFWMEIMAGGDIVPTIWPSGLWRTRQGEINNMV